MSKICKTKYINFFYLSEREQASKRVPMQNRGRERETQDVGLNPTILGPCRNQESDTGRD